MKLITVGKSLLVGAVAVGALSLGTVGMAGAATPTARHFNCARATKTLTRIEKNEAHIVAGLPKLEAREAKALAEGKTTRAARIEKRINRWESATFKARLTKRSAGIEAKCNVSAPPVS
jgi:hypothetical protein